MQIKPDTLHKFSERYHLVGAVLVLLIRDGKILMLLRRNKFDAGFYNVPGGCMEDGESVAAAAVREVYEETGLQIVPEDLRVVSVLNRKIPGEWQSVEFVVVADKFDGEPINREIDKSAELHWFPLDELPINISRYAATAISNFKTGTIFSEIDY